MSINYGQFCPVSKAAEVLGERWTILILRAMMMGSTRFSDFQRALSQISPTLLTKRLAQLVDEGLILRKTAAGGKRVEYYLTASGKELKPIIMELGAWGMRWARGKMSDDELDVELLMHDVCRQIDPSTLPGGDTVLHFTFAGLDQFPRWWIVLENEKPELCINPPGRESDVTLRSHIRTMVEIYMGDLAIPAARREGRLQVEGRPDLVRTVSRWLPIAPTAHVRPASLG